MKLNKIMIIRWVDVKILNWQGYVSYLNIKFWMSMWDISWGKVIMDYSIDIVNVTKWAFPLMPQPLCACAKLT